MATLQDARRLVAKGLSVIPVPRPDGRFFDGKKPRLAWEPYAKRRPTDAELTDWFDQSTDNLAVVTGAVSGVVVIDPDDVVALQWVGLHLPPTPWQVLTPGGGSHCYYGHPGGHVANRVRLTIYGETYALDIRGDGGFVIAAGSLHQNGGQYQEWGDWNVPLTDLPIFNEQWFASIPMSAQDPVRTTDPRRLGHGVTTTPTTDRARRYLAAIPLPEIGHGSDAAVLYAACRLVRGFELSAADADDLLWEWCGNRPGWDRVWVTAKVLNALRYGSEVIGGLR